MILIIGNKWKFNRKEKGLRVTQKCPDCEEIATFQEVVPTEYFAVFGLPVFPTQKERSVLECPSCKTRYHIQTEDYYKATKQLK